MADVTTGAGLDADTADLVTRVRAGDRDAYGILVRRHTPIALRTALVLGAGADAEDVVQDAFVKAYRSLGGFRPGAAFRPWLLAIVANETRNLHRTVRRRTERESRPLLDVPPAGPEERAESRERQALIRVELDRLPAEQREVLVCRFLLDLDERETATVLGISPGTAKSRASRGLRRMRAQLAERTAASAEEVRGG